MADSVSDILRFCQYRERCHSEVRNKLYELGYKTPDVEQKLAQLIEAGTVNEERYARAYARGKFRMLHWGREKIKQQLKLRKISPYCIRKAMEEISGEEYDSTLNKLAVKKWQETYRERNIAARKYKLYRYLVQKGFEKDMVADAINNCIKLT